jgi:hypothetical protein
LWVQDRLRHGDFRVRKVPGKENPADLLTKHLPAPEVQAHMESLGFATSTSRAALAPKLSSLNVHGEEDVWRIEGQCVISFHQRLQVTRALISNRTHTLVTKRKSSHTVLTNCASPNSRPRPATRRHSPP